MPYVYDSGTKQSRFLGGVDAWNRGVVDLAVPDGGETQMLVMMRLWIPTLGAGGSFIVTPTHGQPACYYGLDHGNSHKNTTEWDAAEYSSFCGVMEGNNTAASTVGIVRPSSNGDSKKDNFAFLCRPSYSESARFVSDGTVHSTVAYNTNSTPTASACVMGIPVGETFGQTATLLWRFGRNPTNNSVDLHAWWNFDSVDLANLNVLDHEQLSPNNPMALFPIGEDDSGNKLEMFLTVHDDSFGDDWVTTDGGATNFPGYFMLRHCFPTIDIILQECKVQYGTPSA